MNQFLSNLPAGLLHLLKLSPAATRRLDQTQLAFAAPWPVLLALLLLGLSAGWFTYQYWRDGTRPSWWLKTPLLILRLLAIASLMLMLAQPTLRLRQVEDIRPNVVLMVDNSDSMKTVDARLPSKRAAMEASGTGFPDVTRRTRLDRANALLNRANLLSELSKRYTVRVYTFAAAPHALALPADAKQRAAYKFAVGTDAGQSDSTQIGVALRRPLQDLAGQPLAGALLLSDGGQNLGEDPVVAAEAARQARMPVSTVGLGDPTQTKDVALLSVLADDVVRVNNTVSVYADITQRGYKGKSIAITLRRDREIVGQQTLRLGANDQKQEVRFTYVPTRPGRFIYTVSAAVQPGEIDSRNNSRSFVQTVIDKKLKVLYVEGEPRYEFRYLKNAILRDTSLDFACLLLSGDDMSEGGEGNLKVRGFPATEKELFDYDIIVLGDVPVSYFNSQQLIALRRFVEDRGASLLVIAGEQHMPHEYAGTPLEAVLPCVISPTPDPVITDEPFLWQLTPDGRRSPIMQLEDDEVTTARTWDTLPGMFWAAGVPRAKPGATVLAVHPTRRNSEGPYPLVAMQNVGAGKSFLELVDSTWRWRWRVGDRYFYRYWGQVFRSLTPKELPGNSRTVQLNADRDSYHLGDRVLLNARLLDAYYHPVKAAGVTAVVTNENGQKQQIAMQPTPNAPGLFTAQFLPERAGKYNVTLTSPVNPQAKASAVFVVETLALERQKPELDETLLKKVAASGGGKYYAPDRLADWMKSLPYQPLQVRSEQEIELWDAPLLLILFLLPLGLEWLIRKRRGLL